MPLNNGHSSKVRGLMEQKAQELSSTLTQFIDTQLFTSALLLVSILLAVFACNIDAVSGTYKNIINTPFGFHLDGYLFSMTLHQFVNDFLLTIFFFVLGLEIKREFVIGELSEVSKSLYVILCAVGGALLPVAFYTLLNFNNPQTFHGWAIPMATDTALAIGVLHLFKRLVAKKAFTLIASLAVIDDILSIVIIAAFYTGHFSLTLFLLAMIVLLVLVIFNLSGFRHPLIYIIFGFILWVCIENAGVHGTIAGVLVAMCIPARPKKKPSAAVKNIRQLLNKFENEYDDGKHLLEDEKPHELLEGVTDVSLEATTPLKRWENRLELPVLLFILPLFALTNGGFNIDFAHLSQTITSSVFWGIFLGLVVAKPLGILVTSCLVQKLGIAKSPDSIERFDMIVIACLAGIGYTMSIFITELSFKTDALIDMAKLSIFVSGICSALITTFMIKAKATQSDLSCE